MLLRGLKSTSFLHKGVRRLAPSFHLRSPFRLFSEQSSSPSVAAATAEGSLAEGRELDGPRDVLVQQLMTGNAEWLKIYGPEFSENWFDVLNVQTPRVTCLTCGDSRVSFGSFGCDSPNEMFGIRNIGNQVMVSEGSVKYGLLSLKTPIMIIMGHTGCGAIKASISDYRPFHESVQREIVGLIPSIRYAQEKVEQSEIQIPEDKMDLLLDTYSEINVDFQVAKLMEDPLIVNDVQKAEMTILGMIFDIHNVYKTDHARIKIININGENRVDEIKTHEALGKLPLDLKDAVVQRLFEYEQ